MATSENKGRYVVTFPLKVNENEMYVLEKRFFYAKTIRDRFFIHCEKKYREMIKTRKYRENQKNISDMYKKIEDCEKQLNNLKQTTSSTKEEKKELKEKMLLQKKDIKQHKDDIKQYFQYRNEILKENGFTEFSFIKDIKHFYKPFKTHIGSSIANGIAKNVWKSFEAILFNTDSKKLIIPTHKHLRSICGVSNTNGLRAIGHNIQWNGLIMPILIDYRNCYETECFQDDISYATILRRFIHNKNYYFAQITFKGTPPAKYDLLTGEFKHPLGEGEAIVKIYPSYITFEKDGMTDVFPLCSDLPLYEEELCYIETKMESSRRCCNPSNYEEDGTIRKPQKGEELFWIESKKYKELKIQKHDLNEKIKINRKIEHEKLANLIVTKANSFKIISISAKKEQLREKKKNGKTIMNYAPAMFETILTKKIICKGGEVVNEKM